MSEKQAVESAYAKTKNVWHVARLLMIPLPMVLFYIGTIDHPTYQQFSK